MNGLCDHRGWAIWHSHYAYWCGQCGRTIQSQALMDYPGFRWPGAEVTDLDLQGVYHRRPYPTDLDTLAEPEADDE